MAGYAGGWKVHQVRGHNLLKNPDIIREIDKRRKVSTLKKIASREERQAFWTSVMNDKSQLMRDRLKASEILGKCQGDFIERLDVNVNMETTTILIDGNPVVF